MTNPDIADQIIEEMDHPEHWQSLLDEHRQLLTDQVIDRLKEQADYYVQSDLQKSLQLAEILLYAAQLTGSQQHLALGKLASANIQMVGLGQHQQAVGLYDEAAALYEALEQPVQQARSQIGKVWALANLGRHDEAVETGRGAGRILEQNQEWLLLARMVMNLGILSGRKGDDQDALQQFDRARALYSERLGPDYRADQARVEYNRAIVLRNLGRFDEAIEASQTALDLLQGLGQPMDELRARQTLALTYLVLGRYNEALALFEDVSDAFKADDRGRDAAVTGMFISDCLLRMGRFSEVAQKSREIRQLFSELQLVLEEAQAMVNEAVAAIRLERYDDARALLVTAHQHFEREGNLPWIALTDLEMAALLHREGQFAESLEAAHRCVEIFAAHKMPYHESRARLAEGWAALGLGQLDRASQLAAEAMAIDQVAQIPALLYLGYYLQGSLARAQGQAQEALEKYDQALEALEHLRGQLMVELRADFLADKEAAYMDAVELCLDLNRFDKALEYAERTKSRALLDLITYRLDLSISARSPEDEPLVAELRRLRELRDQLYRRWQSDEDTRGNRWMQDEEATVEFQHSLAGLEKQIEEQWRRLLVRNARYSLERLAWQVAAEPAQPYLDKKTVICEYFAVHGRLIVFLITQDGTQVCHLTTDLHQVQRWVQWLWLNLRRMPHTSTNAHQDMTNAALHLLGKLYQALIAPIGDKLAGYERLVVVPHDFLHYLPFHALYDGSAYLLERMEVSYLPNSSLLAHYQQQDTESNGVLVVGYSHEGQLPFAVQEAESIATLMKSDALLEEQATLSHFIQGSTNRHVVHIATHGSFRPDNPLFSGLALADGWLTALDIFNLRLRASLVTLSSCQTGRSAIAGGDELLGLMRAFLYAGTTALVLSLWSVEDRSTANLMANFYRYLCHGQRKGAALQQAQRDVMRQNGTLIHPYFWASFFLVGNTEPLAQGRYLAA